MRKRTLHKTAAALTALALCAGVLTGCGGADAGGGRSFPRCLQHGRLCRCQQRSFERGGR